MWQEEANLDDRRFLKDIGPIIALAIDGDLAHAHGLIAYFCQKVTAGKIPDIRVTRFVSSILIKSLSSNKLKTQQDRFKIQQAIDEELSAGNTLTSSRLHTENSTYRVAEKFNMAEENVLRIYYGDATIVKLQEVIARGKIPELELLK